MRENLAVNAEHVSKKYCKVLKKSMLYGTQDVLKTMVGIDAHPEVLRPDEFWALDDVSFKVEKGKCLGIIGLNGSGKSTMMKVLAGIISPDKGCVEIDGRVGALIEIGAGFHPSFTGRENIYINSAIMGMTRQEIDDKIDDIIAFADIGDFIDTPVKHYSSGMFARLGFSVAIHCDPDVLLVDEILSVGDLQFSLKCYRKLNDYIRKGKSLIIISHNIQAIRNICNEAIWLDKGRVLESGNVHKVCDAYEKEVMSKQKKQDDAGNKLNYDPAVHLTKVEFLNSDGHPQDDFIVGGAFIMRIHYDCRRVVGNPIFTVSIYNPENICVCSNYTYFDGCSIPSISGKGFIDFQIDCLSLRPSMYMCSITLAEGNITNILEWDEKTHRFNVVGNESIVSYGIINPFPKWKLGNGCT